MEKFDSKSTLDKMIKSINKYADKRDDYDENSGLKIAKKVKFVLSNLTDSDIGAFGDS